MNQRRGRKSQKSPKNDRTPTNVFVLESSFYATSKISLGHPSRSFPLMHLIHRPLNYCTRAMAQAISTSIGLLLNFIHNLLYKQKMYCM